MAKSSLKFVVHPSVVYQLGESLITDAMVAIIELVKNSYDADAGYSKVVIDTQGVTKPDDSYFKDEEGGVITIEDDGCGMSLDDIENGWLTISNRQKLEIKRKKETTKKGRTPLGDKGLGRLGVQKLGKNIEIYTKKRGETGLHIGFSWLDFASSEKLENVEIQMEEVTYPKVSGTKIVISGLMEPTLWKDEKDKKEEKKKKNKQVYVIERLKNELSRLISPYKEIRDFAVYIEVDGDVIDLMEISDALRNTSLLRYKINFNGTNLVVSGRVKLDYFAPNNRDGLEIFEKIVRKDGGAKFLNYLLKQNFAYENKISGSKTNKWFIDFEYKRKLSDIDKVEYNDTENIANPGSFFGEVDAFKLNFYDEEKHIFDQQREYKEMVKRLSGILVYRDGFAIRVDNDWLGLGKQQTSGSSYYGLRPLNTMGFISLTARENMELEETTDREGFKDTPYYRNFFLMLREFIKFTGTIQENIRRTWNDYRIKYEESLSDVEETDKTEDLTKTLEKALTDAPNHQKGINTFRGQISKSKPTADKIIGALTESNEVSSKLRKEAVDLIDRFQHMLEEAENDLNRMDGYLSDLNSLKGLPSVIDRRIASLHEQMEMMCEAVALGLTAESLSHEINNITDQLAIRSKATKTDLVKRNVKDENVLAFIEYVNSATSALQKQMSFLLPTLRYVREKRNEIIIGDFVNEIIAYFNERWDNAPISIIVSYTARKPFTVKINKGKLIQIIDNLILNSEYWLKEDIKNGKMKKGIIDISISPPFIYISDNGRGIDPTVELTLFEPFVSTKTANGRGLGLFIVKQLLASQGCDIELLSERNKRQRFFKFKIDLGGVVSE